jgi:hypothetical protein
LPVPSRFQPESTKPRLPLLAVLAQFMNQRWISPVVLFCQRMSLEPLPSISNASYGGEKPAIRTFRGAG